MERHRTLRAMIQDKSGQQFHACRNFAKSQNTIVRVICHLCKQIYEGLYDWNRNIHSFISLLTGKLLLATWLLCTEWVEDIVFIEMHIEHILALQGFYRYEGDRAEVDIYICHRPWVNDSPFLVYCGWAVAGSSLRWTVGM